MKTLLILLFSITICGHLVATKEYSPSQISISRRASDLRKYINDNSNVDDAITRFQEDHDRNQAAIDKSYSRSLYLIDEIWENADSVFKKNMADVSIKEPNQCLDKLWNDAKIMKSEVLESLKTSYSSNIAHNTKLLQEVQKNLIGFRRKLLNGIETKLSECRSAFSSSEFCWESLDKLVIYIENAFVNLFSAIRDDYIERFSFAEKRSAKSFYDIVLQYHTRLNHLLSNIIKCF